MECELLDDSDRVGLVGARCSGCFLTRAGAEGCDAIDGIYAGSVQYATMTESGVS